MHDLEAGRREQAQPVDTVGQRAIGAGERGVDMAPPDAVRSGLGLQRDDRIGEVGGRLPRGTDVSAPEQDAVQRSRHTSVSTGDTSWRKRACQMRSIMEIYL